MYETISVLLLMQSYDDFHSIPRIFTDSSPTCMDKCLNLGQIGEKASKNVQCNENAQRDRNDVYIASR